MTTTETLVADEDGVILEQPPLPGDDWPEFPPPPPSICEVQTITGPRPVPSVEVNFSGKKLLVAASPEDILMAQQVGIGGTLWMHVEAEVGKTGLQPTKVGVIGSASMQIVQAIRADEEGVLHLYQELERTRDAFHRLRANARAFTGAFDATARPLLPEVDIDDDTEKARRVRALLSEREYLQVAINATEWVPFAKRDDD